MKLKNKTIYQLEKKLRQLEHDGIKTYRIGHIKNRLRIMKQKYSDKDDHKLIEIDVDSDGTPEIFVDGISNKSVNASDFLTRT